ncbi:LptF/LptG family permease [Candidatus Pelagibacter sp.]|nr:LptF/LptG family permease [Candidatus Pelagibacter sp.]
MIQAYKKNLISTFVRNILIISVFFFSLTLVMNVLEEITFFKDMSVAFTLPLVLTFFNSFSILFEIFPFIFLIGTMSFFFEILHKEELIIYKSYGLSNLRIIGLATSSAFFLGIFIILIFYHFSSNLKFMYYDIKNNYTTDDKYLAMVTENGIWIKDQLNGKINIINAKNMVNEYLNDVSITQFNNNNDFEKLITSKKINIKNKIWTINKPTITIENSTQKLKENIMLETSFNSQIISNLFSNLSSLNLIRLQKLKKDYKILGYSTTKINSYQLSIYMYPVYLSIMVCIASILMLNIGHNKPKIYYFLAGILISVLVYYINYLLNILIENQKIPLMFSAWITPFILMLFCLVGLVRVNEK